MSDWAAKRFWKTADVLETDAGYGIGLDGRPVKTPAKSGLIVPTREMADAIASEWDAQVEKVNPDSMPVTRSANAAIDKVVHQHGEVAEMLAAYGDSDLLCYRAESPVELVERQNIAWDPILDWAADTLDAQLETRVGIMPRPQNAGTLKKLADRVHSLSAFQLAAFHDLVSISGSLVLGLAAAENLRKPHEIWEISRVDELYQEELWGQDDEATDVAERKKAAFLHAHRFFCMC